MDVQKLLIFSLFRDGSKISINECGEYSLFIKVLDELIGDDSTVKDLLKPNDRSFEENEDALIRLMGIASTYIKRLQDGMTALEKTGWFKLESFDVVRELEILNDLVVEKVGEGSMSPEAVFDAIVKITIKDINWEVILEYITCEHDKEFLDWDNVFSNHIQEQKVLQYIAEKSLELGEKENYSISSDNFKTIELYRVLKNLTQNEYFQIEGISAKPCFLLTASKAPSEIDYFNYKIYISVNKKFLEKRREFIKDVVFNADNKINTIYIFEGQKKFSLIVIGEMGSKLIEPRESVHPNSWISGLYQIAKNGECKASKNIQSVNNNDNIELYANGFFVKSKIVKINKGIATADNVKIMRIMNDDEFSKKRKKYNV